MSTISKQSAQSAHASDDMTLSEIRAALLPTIIDNAAFDGFGAAAIRAAAKAHRGAGGAIDSDVALLAFRSASADKPLRGVFAQNDVARAIISDWFALVDSTMHSALPAEKLAKMKIRERITALVEARLAALAPHRESLRRALHVLAQPQNVLFAMRLGWRSADVMWQAAGDTARDLNYYSKRTILSSIYSATIVVFLDDDSANYSETRAFLIRRIDEIMKFESWKHRRRANRTEFFDVARFVGKLRYPSR